MSDEYIVEKTLEFVKERLEGEVSGHDFWHSYRVWKLALRIAKEEGNNVDLLVIQLAALLHDIADWKFNEEEGIKQIISFLKSLGLSEDRISHICEIIKNISFKGAKVSSKMKTKEGEIVQDADRLDAIGAIGIARCFATGAIRGQVIYDPSIRPNFHRSFEEYKTAKTTSINHFYEKLLLLKDLMNTKAAKRIAEGRHKFMEQFLERFFDEWEGKD